MNLAEKIVNYMISKSMIIETTPGCVNIVYIEGVDENGVPNADRLDEWNDRRIILMFNEDGRPYINYNVLATTEPGKAPTYSKVSERLGGVARVQFGQIRAHKMGFHKGDPRHPALVQCAPIFVHRDKNKDGKRTGDLISEASGINQHGAKGYRKPRNVGNHSAGCLVAMAWAAHLLFIEILKQDPRYIADNDYIFYTAILNGDHFHTFKN